MNKSKVITMSIVVFLILFAVILYFLNGYDKDYSLYNPNVYVPLKEVELQEGITADEVAVNEEYELIAQYMKENNFTGNIIEANWDVVGESYVPSALYDMNVEKWYEVTTPNCILYFVVQDGSVIRLE